ncbi:Predicted methyltransferase regulatory domain-containing protein [Desulfonatronum zhilinae]|nr:Predicted methyltransferase regulatory domain-containing protein [Desulfonatronum zhilinae]
MTTETTLPNDDGFYVHDVDFRSGVVPNQTPLVIAVAAALGGYAPPDVNESFTYCDLGCGDGTTVCALAAVNPQATFYGVDFNAGHIEKGRKIAQDLNLQNVAFIHSGFEDLQKHDLPVFDLVGMNGIYAWLEQKPLLGVHEFLKTHLRDGGLFYVEYTTLPGMAAVPPLWKLIQTLVPAKGLSSRERAEKGLAMLQTLAKRGMGYLAANQRAAQAARYYITGAKTDPGLVDHFIHNAMASGFKPRYFLEMAEELRPIGLSFAGRTELALNDVELAVPPGQVPTFRDIHDPVMRQVLTDYIRNEQNRRDVFIKNSDPMPEDARHFLLNTLKFLGRSEPEKLPRTIQVIGNHQVGMRGPLFDALIPAFESQPTSVDAVAVPETPTERLHKTTMRLIGSQQFFLCLDRPVASPPTIRIVKPVIQHRINQWLLSQAAEGLYGVTLVSFVTGGATMQFSPVEVCLLNEAALGGFDNCLDMTMKRFASEKRTLPTGHGRIAASKIKREDLEKVLAGLQDRKLHNMLRLGIVSKG